MLPFPKKRHILEDGAGFFSTPTAREPKLYKPDLLGLLTKNLLLTLFEGEEKKAEKGLR